MKTLVILTRALALTFSLSLSFFFVKKLTLNPKTYDMKSSARKRKTQTQSKPFILKDWSAVVL